MAIQNRRGPYNQFDTSKMLPGEWAVVTSGDNNSVDGTSVYMCFAAGNVKRMATYEDMVQNMEQAAGDLIDAAIVECKTAATNANNAANKTMAAVVQAQNAAEKADAATEKAQTAAAIAETAAAIAVSERIQTIKVSIAVEDWNEIFVDNGQYIYWHSIPKDDIGIETGAVYAAFTSINADKYGSGGAWGMYKYLQQKFAITYARLDSSNLNIYTDTKPDADMHILVHVFRIS